MATVSVLLDTLHAARLIRRLVNEWPDEAWQDGDRAIYEEVRSLVTVVLVASRHVLDQSTPAVSGRRIWDARLVCLQRALQQPSMRRVELAAITTGCCSVLQELLQASYAPQRAGGRWSRWTRYWVRRLRGREGRRHGEPTWLSR